jgi:fermentation-respiration switch protein FrsA (DUF1100 family)
LEPKKSHTPAAYAFADARYPAERIVLWGESLGSGVAVAPYFCPNAAS